MDLKKLNVRELNTVEILEIEGGRVRIPPAVKNKLKEAWVNLLINTRIIVLSD